LEFKFILGVSAAADGLSAISFIPLKLHKRIPPLSLTLRKGSKVQRFKGTKVFNLGIE
jgi:hypothetical protein